MSLINLNAFEILKLFNSNKISAVEYVSELISHIKLREPNVEAWAFLNEDLVKSQAKIIDEKRSKNLQKPFAGIPIGVKDIIDTKDFPTENGSKTCVGRKPKEDAHLVKLLRENDIIIFGKCVTTEFALSAPGKTKNPNDLECTPGGSSSGSAAAVADKMIPTSIGTQTGGSVLRPASYNGIIGFKPTFGSISRSGISPISYRLDHPGVYARCIEDIKIISNLIISYDENDYDMINNLSLKENIVEKSDYKFAFVKGPAWPKGDEDMKEKFEEFINNSKLNITEITLPESFDNALQNHEIIMNGGIYSSLKKVYKEDKENLHPYTINRIENGLNLNASDYVDAIENAKKMKFDLSTIFEKFDAIITPAAPGEAPRDLSTTGNAMFNGYWTMMGVPAISLPLLTGENSLPIGIQVITSWQNDNLLLKISDEILKDYQ